MEHDDIAVIGMGCRFPSAPSPEAFWQLLARGDMLSAGEPSTSRVESLSRDRESNFPGGYLDDVASFDPTCFGIAPAEAGHIDPQQRLMLEMTASALDDAGTDVKQLAGERTGVFAGVSTHDFAVLYWTWSRNAAAAATHGTSNAVVANRISYWLGASGPSVTFDTACSSALTALHYACQALRRGEIDHAVVGGVSILLLPPVTAAFAASGVLSATGRCRPFDPSADGYVRSEGAAAVLLKRAADAQRDRDRIYAVVKGTAINHNGLSNGLAAPRPSAQTSVLRRACEDAAILPSALQYVEAMGTATVIGDAIERKALATALGRRDPGESSCIVGSVKANVGHSEAASGMAALLKTALALWHGVIPPTPPVQPDTVADDGLMVNRQAVAWPGARPRIAGVSAFGFGGANASLVLGEAPPAARRTSRPKPSTHVLLLSARSREALDDLVARDVSFLEHTEEETADICFTAASRTHHAHRLAVCGEGHRDLAVRLKEGRVCRGVAGSQLARIAFWFPRDSGDVLAEELVTLGLRPHVVLVEPGGTAPAILRKVPTVEWRWCAPVPPGIRYVVDVGVGCGLYDAQALPAEERVNVSSREDLLAALYVVGAPMDWSRLFSGDGSRKISTPVSARLGEQYWFESVHSSEFAVEREGAGTEEEIDRALDALGY